MNKFKDIAIGMVTGLLVVMFMFAMVTEAKTHTGLSEIVRRNHYTPAQDAVITEMKMNGGSGQV